MNQTAIPWCDLTYNPIVGCSNNCAYCYGRKVAQRLTCPQCRAYEPHFHPERLADLSKGKPSRVFMGSMGDMFDPAVDPAWWSQILLAHEASGFRHKLMVLTKRPDMFGSIIFEVAHPKGPLANKLTSILSKIWFGVTVTCQADEWRIKELLQVPAAGHFVSLEPLLSAIDISPWLGYNPTHEEKQDNGRPSACGSEEQSIRDRYRGAAVETRQAGLGSMEQNGSGEQMPTDKGRKQDEPGLSSGSSDGKGDQSKCKCPPGSVAAFQGRYSPGYDHQSQERPEGRQPAREPGIGDLCRADTPRKKCLGAQIMDGGSGRGEKPPVEANERSREGNIDPARSNSYRDEDTARKENQQAGKEIQCNLQLRPSDNQRKGVAIRFVIIGGLSGSWLPHPWQHYPPKEQKLFRINQSAWANQIIVQAKAAGVPVFVKTKPVKLPGVPVIQEWPVGLKEE